MIPYDYYRIFFYVAKYQGFSKAAEVLGNNQPNLTRCINILENELGCKLFIRSNRGVTLTEEGKRLYSHVAIAVEQLNFGVEELLREKKLEEGRITIGCSETALKLFLGKKLEQFRARYPKIRIRLTSQSTSQAIDGLQKNLVDFSVVITPAHLSQNLTGHVLHEFSETLITGYKFKERIYRACALSEISKFTFISMDIGTSTHEFFVNIFKENNLEYKPSMMVATTDQILFMIKHNLGIGFYPDQLASEEIALKNVAEIPLVEKIPKRQILLVTNHDKPLSSAASKLVDILKE